MLVLFVFFYVLPAAALGLGIWLALFGFRELGLPVSWRRVFFVVAVTVLLAPAVVPAGIIFAAFVPNGMLVLNGDLPILHDARLVSFAAISFLVTGALSFALSWVAVRPRESFSRPECACAANVCKWTASVTGTLKVRGNRALIVFDDSFWLSDRLDIGDETMVGRDDWGSATVYERMTPELVTR